MTRELRIVIPALETFDRKEVDAIAATTLCKKAWDEGYTPGRPTYLGASKEANDGNGILKGDGIVFHAYSSMCE